MNDPDFEAFPGKTKEASAWSVAWSREKQLKKNEEALSLSKQYSDDPNKGTTPQSLPVGVPTTLENTHSNDKVKIKASDSNRRNALGQSPLHPLSRIESLNKFIDYLEKGLGVSIQKLEKSKKRRSFRQVIVDAANREEAKRKKPKRPSKFFPIQKFPLAALAGGIGRALGSRAALGAAALGSLGGGEEVQESEKPKSPYAVGTSSAKKMGYRSFLPGSKGRKKRDAIAEAIKEQK